MAFATIESHLWIGTEGNAIWFLLFFIHLSLSSQIKYLFLSSLWATRSLLHPLYSHRLFCSPLFPFTLFSSHSWATTNFLSTISQIPSLVSIKYPSPFSLSLSLSLIHQSYLVWFSSSQSKVLLFRLASHLIGFVFRFPRFIEGVADSLHVLPIHHRGKWFLFWVVVFWCGGFDFGCLCGGFGVFDGGLWGDGRWWLVRWDVER